MWISWKHKIEDLPKTYEQKVEVCYEQTVEEIDIETRARSLALLRSDALPIRFVREQANSPQTQATLRQLLDQLKTPAQTDKN